MSRLISCARPRAFFSRPERVAVELGSMAVVGIVLAVLSFPLMMKWHYPLLVLSWNAAIGLAFLDPLLEFDGHPLDDPAIGAGTENLDAVGIGHRGAAELLHEQRHGRQRYQWARSALPSIGP